MVKRDVQVGKTYRMNHSSGLIDVRITAVKPTTLFGGRSGDRTVTHWYGTNLKTGKTIEIKSAAKLHREVAGV